MDTLHLDSFGIVLHSLAMYHTGSPNAYYKNIYIYIYTYAKHTKEWSTQHLTAEVYASSGFTAAPPLSKLPITSSAL